MKTNTPWHECTFVAFDTETSGAYPVGYDIVEFGAVKWKSGQEIDRLQVLLKPREPMSDFNMSIHGITNDMVAQAPVISEVIAQIADFFKGAVLLAHHAPFDLGFVAIDFELNQIPFPTEPVLCTSLLSRKLIHSVQNHKLQTLIKYLNIDGGSAHRAFDDARACLYVGLECLKRLGENATIQQALDCQEKKLNWTEYSVIQQKAEPYRALVEAINSKKNIEMLYDKGTVPRQIAPVGIVRNPDGDFVYALCLRDMTHKRFYLGKIKDPVVLY